MRFVVLSSAVESVWSVMRTRFDPWEQRIPRKVLVLVFDGASDVILIVAACRILRGRWQQ